MNTLTIGVFDSGLGGVTILHKLQQDFAGSRFIYLGDTARTPYGTKTPETVQSYTRDCVHFLLNYSPDVIVTACNTASALALPVVRREFEVPIVGTIQPAALQCVRATTTGRIGVVATPATIASEMYHKTIHALKADVEVLSKACPLFVPLVEEGIYSGEIVRLAIDRYLSEMRAAEIDTLLLGCTHYPLLKDAIAEYFGEGVRIVECSEGVSYALAELFPQSVPERAGNLTSNTMQGTQYFVTDPVSSFSQLASMLLRGDVRAQLVQI